MVLSHHFLVDVFRREFAPQLVAIVDALESRLLPAFQTIEAEAEAISEEAWEGFMSAPAIGEEDPGDCAEAAEEAGVSHYLLLDGIRQGMLNLFAAALHHAFEQHVLLFMRRQLFHPAEENDAKPVATIDRSVRTRRAIRRGDARRSRSVQAGEVSVLRLGTGRGRDYIDRPRCWSFPKSRRSSGDWSASFPG